DQPEQVALVDPSNRPQATGPGPGRGEVRLRGLPESACVSSFPRQDQLMPRGSCGSHPGLIAVGQRHFTDCDTRHELTVFRTKSAYTSARYLGIQMSLSSPVSNALLERTASQMASLRECKRNRTRKNIIMRRGKTSSIHGSSLPATAAALRSFALCSTWWNRSSSF